MWLLIANPTAHSGDAGKHVGEAIEALARQGVRARLRLSLPGGATVADVAHALAADRYDGVIAMGGDGTFHEVANGLLRSGQRLPMGVLPAGTGNNQARSLGLPIKDLDRAAFVVAHGVDTPVDGGLLTGEAPDGTRLPARWFFDSMGFGFSARALRARFEDQAAIQDVPLIRDIYRDLLVYAGAVTRALLASYVEDQRFAATVTTEDGPVQFDDLIDLVVNNTRVYARVWVLDDRSRHDDGRMEVVPIQGRDEWLARAIIDLDGNPMREWWAEVIPSTRPPSARDIEIVLAPRPDGAPIDVQVDGEIAPEMQRALIQVRAGALQVRAPETDG